ncbi:MAG: hypothetical protein QNM01_02630 [Actinomycetes bacterium]
MSILLLRLLLTPTLVVLVSYIQKRWGHALGGRVIGLPLSTGPFLILIYLMDGAGQTANAAHGVVAGQIAVVSYCYIFTYVSWRKAWPIALLAGWFIAGLADFTLTHLASTWLAGATVVFVSAIAIKFWPRPLTDDQSVRVPQWWETPMKALIAGTLVATLTKIKDVIGVQEAGVLASMPVILSVLAPTTVLSYGPAAVSELLRGTTKSLGGSVMFSTVVAAMITVVPAPVAFALGLAALISTDLVLTWSRRNSSSEVSLL